MLDTRQKKGEPLTQVTEDDPQSRKAVEQPAQHQTKRMNGRFSTKAPWRVRQDRMTLVHASLTGQRTAGMKVDGHAKRFHAGPKIPYGRLVEVLGGVHIANVRIAVDHRPLEPQLRDGALQLVA